MPWGDSDVPLDAVGARVRMTHRVRGSSLRGAFAASPGACQSSAGLARPLGWLASALAELRVPRYPESWFAVVHVHVDVDDRSVLWPLA